MLIDKETGNIIFDENVVLKAEMTIDEIKNSSIMKLLDESSVREIDGGEDIAFRPITSDGTLIHIDIDMLFNKAYKVTIRFDEVLNIYNTGISEEDFFKSVKKHENFMKKTLQLDEIVHNLNFKWGYVEIRANINIPIIEINLFYVKLRGV